MSVSTDLKFDAARDMEDVGADGIPIAPKVGTSGLTCTHAELHEMSPMLRAAIIPMLSASLGHP